MTSGRAVKAIAAGTVAMTWNSDARNSAVMVRHQGSEGLFYAVYGHTRPTVTVGASVTAGQTVGTLLAYGSPTHLHFGINTSSSTSFISGSFGWGTVPSWANPSDSGWVNAIPYLARVRATLPIDAPTGLSASVSSGRVDFSWLAASGANCRVQVSTNYAAFSTTSGFDSSSSPNWSVPVNAATAAGLSAYTWTSGSAGSYSGPQPGTTYYWTVRQNTSAQGASAYSQPRSFTMPSTIAQPALSLSTTSLTRSVSQYSTPTSSSFTVRNSGGGMLSYSISSSSAWMSVSPSYGTSTGESDSISVNFNTSSYSPQTLYGSLTVNGGSAGSQTISVQVTITGSTTTSDDHGNYTWNASTLYRWSSYGGNIEQAYDTDMFRITVNSAGTVTFYTTGSTDTTGTLYDANGYQLLYNDDANGSYNFYLSAYLSPGTYYLGVRGYSSRTGSYVVYSN
jgi:Peptidase family M23/Viral BACON domain